MQVFQNGLNLCPYLLIRHTRAGQAWYSMMGAHELTIYRDGSALELRRWCQTQRTPKPWAILYFLTWEEMVLFYCSFLSLKMRNTLTVSIDPQENKLRRENRLFQAKIIDDGFKHSLIVYEDEQAKGIRLHAAVWEGELRECPVWTAFGKSYKPAGDGDTSASLAST